MNMWTNAYGAYGNFGQRDAVSNNWLNQNTTSRVTNPFGLQFENYQSAATNPFAGQTYGSIYQPYNFGNGFGYQYRGW